MPDIRRQGSARGCCVEGVEIYRGEDDAPGREDLAMIRGRVERTEQEDAFTAEQPVYLRMEQEIRRVCGDDVYEELAVYCRAQRARRPRRLALLPIAP
jgi:hypothetical protein